MKKTILFIMILFIPFVTSAKEYKMEWQKNYDGNAGLAEFNGGDRINSSVQTDDGIVFTIGDIYTEDRHSDGFIASYDTNGNQLWKKYYDGRLPDYFNSIVLTSENDVVVLGSSSSAEVEGVTINNKGGKDGILIKYNKDGEIVWQQNFGGTKLDEFNDFVQLNDGSFVVVGTYESTDILGLSNKGRSDAVIIKYDKNGNMVWQNSWGTDIYDNFTKITKSNDDGFIVYGDSGTPQSGVSQYITVKYDSNGNMIWENKYSLNNTISIEEIFYLNDGSFIVLGNSNGNVIDGITNNGGKDIVILKYDKDENLVLKKSWGGNQNEYIHHVIRTKDDNFIINIGSSSTDLDSLPNKGYSDSIMLKLDKNGNIIWENSFGGNSDDEFYGMFQTKRGDIIAYGYLSSTDIDGLPNKGECDGFVLKYDIDGNLLWQKSYGGSKYDYVDLVHESLDGGILLFAGVGSTDIEGLTKIIDIDRVIVKYLMTYNLQKIKSQNGDFEINQQGNYAVINSIPNEGYEVDNIVVKDNSGNVLDVEVIKQDDGTYVFELFDDVSVEVLFKEILTNPKTGVFNPIIFIPAIMVLGMCVYFIKSCEKSYEL